MFVGIMIAKCSSYKRFGNWGNEPIKRNLECREEAISGLYLLLPCITAQEIIICYYVLMPGSKSYNPGTIS